MNQGIPNIHNNLINIIRISNIKRMIFPVLLVALLWFILVKIPFSDILIPKNIDTLNSLSQTNVKNIEYFSISSKDWLYSGYNNYKDKSIKEYIFYKLEDETCYYLLVTPEKVNKKGMTLNVNELTVATHERTDSFNSFLNQFALDINWNFESLNEASAPIILTTTSYNLTLYKILFVVLTVGIIYLSAIILYFALIIAFPLLSPVLGSKHRHSSDRIKSRSEFAMLLQAELDNHIYNTNHFYITNNYIINLKYDEISVIPLNKLCFMFEHGNLQQFLWFYTKLKHTIYFLCSNSLKSHLTHNNSKNIEQILSLIKELVPDIMIGYSAEHQMKYLEIVKEKRH